MLVSYTTPDTTFWQHNWSLDETEDLIELWGEAVVHSQFTHSGHSNAHTYEGLMGLMQEHGHNWSACQSCIKVKSL